MMPRLWLVRLLVVLCTILGLNYIIWRWLFSVHWTVWWIAVPLVMTETYSLIDSLLFGLTVWRLRLRPEPGPPAADATVDVFIATYNEPVDLLRITVQAAIAIEHPHQTWVLDDGNRAEVRAMAEALGAACIARSADWRDRPRHAKAGNLNNALMSTQGEFILFLDADQVPSPQILDRTLGYFADPEVALVQTQQFFHNVPAADPLGSQAPLFYGPIQQGKDGWNAAFFCGSNAILRREALMRLGVARYVSDLEHRVSRALAGAELILKRARKHLGPDQRGLEDALRSVAEHARSARAELRDGHHLADVTLGFQRQVAAAARVLVELHVQAVAEDMGALTVADPALNAYAIGDIPVEAYVVGEHAMDEDTLDRLSRRDWSPLGAIEAVRLLISSVDVDREDEAQPIMPISVISVTEDMATCMRLHAAGWKTVYHDETLCLGLAPEDLKTMLSQRLRWAQGTMQVLLRENPLVQRGLSFGQRLMYLATMWSYLSGFAALIYIAAPVLYLDFGVLPVRALSTSFFLRLIPFLVINQLLFMVIGRGRKTWRGQQYALALFPIWIRAFTSAVSNVVFGRSLAFAVTPKTKQVATKLPWHLVRPQLIAMALLISGAVIGSIRWANGSAGGLATGINLVWVAFDVALFSVVIQAVRYRGFEPDAVSVIPTTEEHVSAIVVHIPEQETVR
jgi:cellulose synthase (UDP-forming)